ncbi:MAG: hypothetical protein JWL95_878, partial [Gemmatimonadetes bacterium]|nr:hypothetical protein [Gemmatimonadota bacterium]
MLHVLLATALSASTAISADSVRPAAKPGPVRPDSAVFTLPAPTIRAPRAPAPTIAALVTL